MGAGDKNHLETLLAWVGTALADLVILSAAILAQEETPFQPPLFTPVSYLNGLYASAARTEEWK